MQPTYMPAGPSSGFPQPIGSPPSGIFDTGKAGISLDGVPIKGIIDSILLWPSNHDSHGSPFTIQDITKIRYDAHETEEEHVAINPDGTIARLRIEEKRQKALQWKVWTFEQEPRATLPITCTIDLNKNGEKKTISFYADIRTRIPAPWEPISDLERVRFKNSLIQTLQKIRRIRDGQTLLQMPNESFFISSTDIKEKPIKFQGFTQISQGGFMSQRVERIRTYVEAPFLLGDEGPKELDTLPLVLAGALEEPYGQSKAQLEQRNKEHAAYLAFSQQRQQKATTGHTRSQIPPQMMMDKEESFLHETLEEMTTMTKTIFRTYSSSSPRETTYIPFALNECLKLQRLVDTLNKYLQLRQGPVVDFKMWKRAEEMERDIQQLYQNLGLRDVPSDFQPLAIEQKRREIQTYMKRLGTPLADQLRVLQRKYEKAQEARWVLRLNFVSSSAQLSLLDACQFTEMGNAIQHLGQVLNSLGIIQEPEWSIPQGPEPSALERNLAQSPF